MKLIIAYNNLGYIGLNGKLPWFSKEDLKHFKEFTLNKRCLVGRTTYESLPPLNNRELLVVGKGFLTLEEALKLKPEIVIGGKKLYESVYHLCDEIHISIIDDNTIGDTMAPLFKDYTGKIFIYKFSSNSLAG